jgi:23S rRNA (guanosine2251-2'-O)-methyltransferase
MSDEQTYLEGHIAITAALEAESRPIETILLDRAARDRGRHLARLARLAADRGVPVERVAREAIDLRASGGSHGGALAVAGPRRFVDVGDLLVEGHPPFIVMLDGVEDPFNFGQAIRACYAAGADGLVVRPRNWMSAAAVVARASAGASELIPTAIAETAEDAAAFFRARGLAVATTGQTRGAVSLYAADLTRPLFVLIGGEKRGVTRSFLERADLVLHIPYGRGFKQSLGTTAATAILAFEVMRQRMAPGE